MRELSWVLSVSLVLAAGSAAATACADGFAELPPAPIVAVIVPLGLAAVSATYGLVTNGKHRWAWWPVAGAVPVLLILFGGIWSSSSGELQSLGTIAVGEGFEGLWAVTGGSLAWLLLARAAGATPEERPAVAVVVRDALARWADGGALLGLAWVLTWAGTQFVLPGLVFALAFAQLPAALVHEPDQNAFLASGRALARAPLAVTGLLLGSGLLGAGMAGGLVFALYGGDALTTFVFAGPTVTQAALASAVGSLPVCTGQMLLVRAWRGARVEPAPAVGSGDATNPWAAGG